MLSLDLLATAVILLDDELRIRHANSAAENLLELSHRRLPDLPITQLFTGAQTLATTAKLAMTDGRTYAEHDLTLNLVGRQLHLDCTITPVHLDGAHVLLEFKLINQQIKVEREERALQESLLNRELIRNLAHEIRNPLGGIRGAAQLLENELERKDLTEYTQVIIREADRLQALLDRLLTPSRIPRSEPLNVHQILEQVRSVIQAEYPNTLTITRDYDPSLPDLIGDAHQLSQAFLNIVRNAAQALHGPTAQHIAAPGNNFASPGNNLASRGGNEIILRTRVARRATVAKKNYRLAIAIEVIDNGPGIPADALEKIFFPLYSGRDGGSGLGLTIAQTYINQQRGTIEVHSEPGRTCFTVMLPVLDRVAGAVEALK